MRAIRFVPVLGAVAAIAGCGGSSGLSHDEYLKQANALCADYNTRLAALGSPKAVTQFPAFATKLLPIAQDDIGKFKALKPPKPDAAAHDAYGKQGDKLIAALKDLIAAGKDVPAIERVIARESGESARSRQIATQAGLTECAK